MKKLLLILCLITILLSSSCSSKTHIPSQKKLVSYMESAGYKVDRASEIVNINDVSRIIATKGDSILDVCYQVKDGDFDKILDFYGYNYEKAYITGCINDFIYYASDEAVWKISKIDTNIEN